MVGLFLCLLGLLAQPVSAKTAMQIYVEAMQPGWNLGNTLDATPSETAWGNPLVTQEFIQQIKAQGYKSIRIPVTWDTGSRLGAAPDYKIDPAWLARVQQVVDWSLDAGLLVMLNVHHDSYWVRKMPADHDGVLGKFNAIWTQVAERFRDYPSTLMLESINEPEFDGVDDATKMALLNELNTSFFHIVRGFGGANATRPLVLPSVNTNSGQAFLDSLKATMAALNDSNLIATVHYYGFWPFSVNIAGVTTVNDAVIADIDAMANNTYNTFVADGIPVVVGELGLLSFDPTGQIVERGESLKYFEYAIAAMRAKDITWQLWDAGGQFNRYTYQWNDPEMASYYMQGVTTRSSTAASDLVFLSSTEPVRDAVVPLNLNGNTFVSLTNGSTTLTPDTDYSISGSTLTIKASTLAAYASGSFGEKAVFSANFSAGMPWKLRIRYAGAPALGISAGTKGGGDLAIPAAFNGDLLATMEAKYVATPYYPYPGPASWTSFKQSGDVFHADYDNNILTLKKSFFDNTDNKPVDLILHFWSGRVVNYRLSLEAGAGSSPGDQEWVIYENGLTNWNNWGGWAANNPDNTDVAHSAPKSISVDAGAWGAIVLQYNPWEPVVDTSAFHTLVFWIHGGSVGGQNLGVRIIRGDDWSSPGVGIPTPVANTWTKVEIPLSALGVEGSSNITRVMIQNWRGENIPTFYVDDIKLTSAFPSDVVFVNGAPAPVVTSPTIANGVFNASFSYQISAINAPTSFGATGLPAGLSLDSATGLISGTPSSVGSYPVTVSATNASGDSSQGVVINVLPATASVELSDLSFIYDGSVKQPTVVTTPAGLPVSVTYDGAINAPANAGSYTVVAKVIDPNYSAASAVGTLVIKQATATFSLPAGNSAFNTGFNTAYNGSAQPVSVTTSPADVAVTVTYNGSTTAPTLPGTYRVVVTSNDPNYVGSVSGTLVITATAVVRNAPTLNGDLDGSLQLLSPASFAVNSGASVSSDLLVPGTPTVKVNGSPLLGGIIDSTGLALPSNYTITLNNGSVVRYIVRHVNSVAMTTVAAPAKPVGTRDVTVNSATVPSIDFSTLRSLTLNGGAGIVTVPAGNYGSFTLNGGTTIVLGTPGATQPAVYALQGLTINSNATLKIAGPVRLVLASGINVNGILGNADHADWLDLKIAQGSLTVNGGATANALITAPLGTVTINGTIHGRVIADRLVINGNGVLVDPSLL